MSRACVPARTTWRNSGRIPRRSIAGNGRAPCSKVVTGASIPAQVGDIAMSAKGEKTQAERVCDAQVYFGLLQLAAGDKSEARALFKVATKDCPAGVAEATELTVANLELKGLGEAAGRTTRGPSGADVAATHQERGHAYFDQGQVDRDRRVQARPGAFHQRRDEPGDCGFDSGHSARSELSCSTPGPGTCPHLRYRKPRPISQEPGQPRPAAQGKQRFRSHRPKQAEANSRLLYPMRNGAGL